MSEFVPNCVLRLLKFGLVIVEDERRDERCSVCRPVGLNGTPFPGWEEGVPISQRGTYVQVNAPPADLYSVETPSGKRWIVDLSVPAAPGLGPVWFHEEFASVEFAVEAIRECYFADRVDFNSESLGPWGRRRRD
jgi:hypothetical protein